MAERINFRLSDHAVPTIKDLAKSRGLTVSGYCRWLLEREVGQVGMDVIRLEMKMHPEDILAIERKLEGASMNALVKALLRRWLAGDLILGEGDLRK